MMALAEDRPRSGRIEGGYDAIIIGGEPEGLVCAISLARAGLKTVLLEAGDVLGGRFQARQFGDFLAPAGDYLLHHLDRQAVKELDLYRFGLEFANRRMPNVLFVDNAPLALDPDPWRSALAISDIWPDEAVRYESYAQALGGLGAALADMQPERACADEVAAPSERLAQFEKKLNADQYALLSKAAFAPAGDLCADYISDPRLRAALCYEALFGSGARATAHGGGAALLRRFMGEVAGARGAVALPAGGTPTIVEALRRAAESAKVEIRHGARVREIIIEWDAAVGVRLGSGGQIRAGAVISAQGAFETLSNYIGPHRLDIELADEIANAVRPLAAARFNAVLDAPATFAEGVAPLADGRFLFIDSVEAHDAAIASAARGEFPAAPAMEFVFAGHCDEAFRAGDAQAVLGMIYPLPADFEDGGGGAAAPDALIEAAILRLETAAPNIRERIVDAEIKPAPAFGALSQRPLAEQWLIAPDAINGFGVQGFYCCGADVALGLQTAFGVARAVAQKAAKHARKRAAL